MLSGFVLANAYGEKLRRGWPKRTYWMFRIGRLYPMILLGAAIGVAGAVWGSFPPSPLPQGRGLVIALIAAATSIPLPIGNSVELFPINGPEWSLFFELVASAAFGLFIFQLRQRTLCIVTAILLLPYLYISRSRGILVGDIWPGLPFGFLRLGLPFVIGVLCQARWRAGVSRGVRAPTLLLAAALICSFVIPGTEHLKWLISAAIVVIIYPMIITAAANSAESGLLLLLARASGDLSYPFYVIHVPIMTIILPQFLQLGLHGALASAAAVGAIAILALAVHRRIDAPIQRLIRSRL